MDFENLVDRIYEASAQPELWPAVLTEVAQTVEGEGGFMAALRNDGWQWGGFRISSTLAKRAEDCFASGAPDRSIATARLLGAEHCGFLSDEELFSEQEYANDALTTEWAIPNRVYHGAATAIHAPTGELVVVQIMRRIGTPGLSRSDLDRLDTFRPHLARAGFLAARWRLQRMRAAAEALAMIGLPAAILDVNGRVLAANDLLEAMASHLLWLPGDQIAFKDRAATTLLRRAVRDLCTPAAPSVRSFPARGEPAGQTVIVHLVPASRSARDVFGGQFGILAVTAVTAPEPPDTALIQGLFDLTPAEARVACGIVKGLNVADMAERHGVACETVRTQVKAVLAKTGARRQADAAATLAGLPRLRAPSVTGQTK